MGPTTGDQDKDAPADSDQSETQGCEKGGAGNVVGLEYTAPLAWLLAHATNITASSTTSSETVVLANPTILTADEDDLTAAIPWTMARPKLTNARMILKVRVVAYDDNLSPPNSTPW